MAKRIILEAPSSIPSDVAKHAVSKEDLEQLKEKVEEEKRYLIFIKVRMLETKRGSPDPQGIEICEYKQDEVYDLPLPLAEIFLENNWAEEIQEKDKKLED